MEGDEPKEPGKQPRVKKSRIREAGRKRTHGAVRQARRGLAPMQEEARSHDKSWSEGADGWSGGIPPNCRDERQERKGNTRGVEKPLAAKTVLLVNWQQANTLITKLLYGQEKHWQQSNLHSSGDRTDPALGMLPLPTHTQDRSTPRPRSQAKHEQRLKIIPPSAELLLISD